MSNIEGTSASQLRIGKNTVLKVKTLILNSDADLQENVNNKGEIRYNKDIDIVEYNDGEDWKPFVEESKLVTLYGTFSPFRLDWDDAGIYGPGGYNVVEPTNTNMTFAPDLRVYTSDWNDTSIYFIFGNILSETISTANLSLSYGFTDKRHLMLEVDLPVMNTGTPLQFAVRSFEIDHFKPSEYYKDPGIVINFTLNYTKI